MQNRARCDGAKQATWRGNFAIGVGILLVAGIRANKLYDTAARCACGDQVYASQGEYVPTRFAARPPD